MGGRCLGGDALELLSEFFVFFHFSRHLPDLIEKSSKKRNSKIDRELKCNPPQVQAEKKSMKTKKNVKSEYFEENSNSFLPF